MNAHRWINFLLAVLVRKLLDMGCTVGGLGGGAGPKHFTLTQWWASSCLELEKEDLVQIDRGADECGDSKYTSKWVNHLVTPSHPPCALYSLKKK